MISRVIEAKPDELRVFLEEAAGISRYKERRRETENRLADTRENLARVNDIRTELGAQIEKLEGQAKVASRYKELQEDLQLKQHLLWFLRRKDAAADREKHARDIAARRQRGRGRHGAAARGREPRRDRARGALRRGRRPECGAGGGVRGQRRGRAPRVGAAARGGEPQPAREACIPSARCSLRPGASSARS